MTEGIAVLVVDEDEDMLELTETFLERESDSIRVATEPRPAEAIDRAVSGKFDCVVTDLRMPEVDGLELCKRVREQRPDLPCFLFTGVDRGDIEDRIDDRITGVIRKGAGTDHYTDLAERIEAAVTG